TSIEASSERSVAPDQLAQAASRSDGQGRNYQRRGSVVHSRTKEPNQDYTYGQLELNLIRPEHETSSLPPHGKINAYYGSSTTQSNNVPHEEAHHDKALDESETAAEYVVNAMKMAYGTRHKDAQQPQLRQLQHQQQHQQPQQQHHQQQQHLEQEAHKQAKAQAQAALLEAQMQAELQAQLVEQQALLLVEQQRQQHLQQQQQQPHAIESTASEASPPAPAPVYEKESGPRSYEIYETPAQPDTEPGAAVSAAPTGAAGGDIERLYRTKYYSYPAPQPYRSLEAEAEEKVRVSASTEIPKAEIMKQIEKSVIKYMKELEAEGKIITTPQELSPPATKTYYKLLSLPNSSRDVASSVGEEKRYSSNGGSNSGGISGSGSTVRPKYSSSSSGNGGSGHGRQPIAHISSQQHTQYHQQQQSQLKPVAHALTKPQRYQAETETAYQAPELSAEALAPNVEFIYKIKTRAPLQTATVKTVSKPYTLPLKSSAEHFDHGAAMKNIEEFDLSHVVTTPERELEQERVTSKPQKLYFNSEIYHDINSLPYKGEKLRGSHLQHAPQEYRHKLKSSGELHPDYKGYSGYFAEPASSMELAEKQPVSALEGEESEEMGYPIPYQYVLKKEPLSSKYEEERESWESLRLAHGKPNSGGYKSSAAAAAGGSSSSSLDYDSYSPKFNNNPEGYGYQHTYKTRGVGSPGGGQSSGSNGIKRGKRGGAAHPQAGKKLLRGGGNSGGGGATIVGGGKHMKDLEANLALRPPPK
ncbi:hypothetical protein KR215_005146, partial [Drosophila sulfurigaster]